MKHWHTGCLITFDITFIRRIKKCFIFIVPLTTILYVLIISVAIFFSSNSRSCIYVVKNFEVYLMASTIPEVMVNRVQGLQIIHHHNIHVNFLVLFVWDVNWVWITMRNSPSRFDKKISTSILFPPIYACFCILTTFNILFQGGSLQYLRM